MHVIYQWLSILTGEGNILVSSVDSIPDWPGFEPRDGRHSAVPSSWADLWAIYGRGGLVGARMDPDTPGTCVLFVFKKNYM